MTGPLLLDSITDAGTAATGRVVASGSHGGVYPAAVASNAGVHAVAFNDAGIGCQQAGIAGILALGRVGMAAIAADAMTCRIGDAADLHARGRISAANGPAEAMGVRSGMAVADALALLGDAPAPERTLPVIVEARRRHLLDGGLEIELLDSASLVTAADAGRIVVTGSHGALIGGDPARAIKAPVRLAVFSDAGVGPDGVGITRLPALDARGIAAATVAARSARIGDARSALETGIISHANAAAGRLGARPGARLSGWLRTFA